MAIIALSPGLSGHLKRQLIFLRNSVAAYDNGCVEEAIRIGVVIRVLCHDTQSSVSRLKQMGQRATLRLVTTAKTLPNDLLVVMDVAELMAGMTFGCTLEYYPIPEGSPAIPCADWWGAACFRS